MPITSGKNWVTLEDRKRGRNPLEKRYLTITLDRPGYCVCTGNVPLENVEPEDMQELHFQLGALLGRAEERGKG